VIGHSLGGTVATTYAGLRPGRCASVINIEGFGMALRAHTPAPVRVRKWLDELRRLATPKRYASLEELAVRIARRHPRLPLDRAHYLAWAWSRQVEGGYEIAADPKHRLMQPVRLRRDELDECWAEIRCPMLLLVGAESEFLTRAGGDVELARWRALVRHMEFAMIAGAGHMVPHEQPERLASEIMRFVNALSQGQCDFQLREQYFGIDPTHATPRADSLHPWPGRCLRSRSAGRSMRSPGIRLRSVSLV